MGGFFYDMPPNGPAQALRAGERQVGWQTDATRSTSGAGTCSTRIYTVRGFISAISRRTSNKLYTQLGEPRNWGMHVTARSDAVMVACI